MDLYELLLFLHVAAAIIWIGAGFVLALLVFGAERANDRLKEAGYMRDIDWLAPRLFIPASLATLLLGILVVIEGPWSFGDLWIVIGLGGWAASFLVGILYFKPEGERIAHLVESQGPGSREAGRRLQRLNVVDRIQLTLLFVVVANMVVKPTGDDVGALVALAAVFVLACLAGLAAVRRHAPEPVSDEPVQGRITAPGVGIREEAAGEPRAPQM